MPRDLKLALIVAAVWLVFFGAILYVVIEVNRYEAGGTNGHIESGNICMASIRTAGTKRIIKAGRADWSKWIRSEADEMAVRDGCYFDETSGLRVVNFFERYLYHTEGRWAGEPFGLMDWQRNDIIMPMYGWKREDGTRRFRMALIEVAKKNGKSGLCSGLELYHLMADGEESAQVYSAAKDRDQASIVHNSAAEMVRKSPRLAQQLACGALDIVDSRKTIVYWPTASRIKALSADVETKEGLNWSALIFDELHAQQTPKLWDTLRYGGAARLQWLMIAITTAGYDKTSIGWEQHEHAVKVIEGTVQDNAFFAYIRAADKDDDYGDPEVWRKANPSLGIIISEEDFERDYQEAIEIPRKLNSFLRYRLNIWTEQSVRWLMMDRWDEGGAPFDEAMLEGHECYGGLDLASTTDIAAFGLDFLYENEVYSLNRFWLPEEQARRREQRDRVPYLTWARQGLITLTPGDVIDYDRIRRDINGLYKIFNIREIAVDRWNATQITTQLDGDGLTMVEFGQGFASMSGPSKEFEALVMGRRFRHGSNPVLRWMASNVAVKDDAAGNIKPDKEKSAEKIDGIVANIMGIGRLFAHEDMSSVYETQEVFAV